MVAQQVLVLFVQVRILVVQQPIKESPKRQSLGAFFFFIMWLRKCLYIKYVSHKTFYLILFLLLLAFASFQGTNLQLKTQ